MARILLIEDDQAVADAILFVLKRHGHDIDHASNTVDAKKLLSQADYDCAFVDVWLGEEDGLGFLADQRAALNDMSFIVISGGGPGRTLENVTARADAYGAVAMLYKPFEDEELLQALNMALKRNGTPA